MVGYPMLRLGRGSQWASNVRQSSVQQAKEGAKVSGTLSSSTLNILEDGVSQSRHDDDRKGNGEIGNDSSDVVVAAESRSANLTQPDGEEGSTKTQNQTEKSNSHVVVLHIFFDHLLVVRVISTKVVEKSNLGGGDFRWLPTRR